MVFDSKSEEVKKVHDFYTANSRIDYSTGEFYVVNVPAMRIRRETFYNLWQEVFKATGRVAYTLMYSAGFTHGKDFFWTAKGILNVRDLNQDAISKLMGFLCCENVAIGFGAVKVEIFPDKVVVTNERGFPVGREIYDRMHADKDFVLDGEIKITHEEDVKMSGGVAFNMMGKGEDINPTADSYFLGYFAGFLSMIYRISKGKELSCVSRNDNCCKFVYNIQK